MRAQSMSRCKINGWQIAYHRIGKGEPVMLIHGITTYSFIWDRLVPLLSDKYELIIPDLLGCGYSDKPLNVEYSLINHAEILKNLLSNLDIEKVHFVGHDVGGGIGQIFIIRYPERLIDLTMINTVAYDYWPVQPIIAMRTPIIRQLAMASIDLGSFKLLIRRALYHKDRLTRELFEKFWQQMKTNEGRKAFLHFAKCLNNQHLMDLIEDLRRISQNVLIIRGNADVFLSPKISERLHEDIPNSKYVKIATGGHFIQEDEPEQLAGHLISFFTKT